MPLINEWINAGLLARRPTGRQSARRGGRGQLIAFMRSNERKLGVGRFLYYRSRPLARARDAMLFGRIKVLFNPSHVFRVVVIQGRATAAQRGREVDVRRNVCFYAGIVLPATAAIGYRVLLPGNFLKIECGFPRGVFALLGRNCAKRKRALWAIRRATV